MIIVEHHLNNLLSDKLIVGDKLIFKNMMMRSSMY